MTNPVSGWRILLRRGPYLRWPRHRCAAILALAIAASLAGRSLGRMPHAVSPSSTPPPEVQPAGQIELPRLVDLAAQRLGVNLQYDAAALRGSVTLRLGAGISDEELWALTNRVLASQGFTTVRMHGDGDTTYSVVRLADAPGLARFGVGGWERQAALYVDEPSSGASRR